MGLGAASRLPRTERKLIGVLSCQYFITDLNDQAGLFFREFAQRSMTQCGRFLDQGKCLDEALGELVRTKIEVLQCPLGLRPPQLRPVYLDCSQAIGFQSCAGHRCWFR